MAYLKAQGFLGRHREARPRPGGARARDGGFGAASCCRGRLRGDRERHDGAGDPGRAPGRRKQGGAPGARPCWTKPSRGIWPGATASSWRASRPRACRRSWSPRAARCRPRAQERGRVRLSRRQAQGLAGLPAERGQEARGVPLEEGILKPGGAAAHLTVNDKPVPMNEFVARALAGVIEGFVGTLRDVESPGKIELTIKRRPLSPAGLTARLTPRRPAWAPPG